MSKRRNGPFGRIVSHLSSSGSGTASFLTQGRKRGQGFFRSAGEGDREGGDPAPDAPGAAEGRGDEVFSRGRFNAKTRRAQRFAKRMNS